MKLFLGKMCLISFSYTCLTFDKVPFSLSVTADSQQRVAAFSFVVSNTDFHFCGWQYARAQLQIGAASSLHRHKHGRSLRRFRQCNTAAPNMRFTREF